MILYALVHVQKQIFIAANTHYSSYFVAYFHLHSMMHFCKRLFPEILQNVIFIDPNLRLYVECVFKNFHSFTLLFK